MLHRHGLQAVLSLEQGLMVLLSLLSSLIWLLLLMQNSSDDMTFETSNASMVSGLVDYMSTLVSGGEATITAGRRSSGKPPPLPPKVHRVASANPCTKPVCVYVISVCAAVSLSVVNESPRKHKCLGHSTAMEACIGHILRHDSVLQDIMEGIMLGKAIV